jgi:8-oxo-dGTP diphosphatase
MGKDIETETDRPSPITHHPAVQVAAGLISRDGRYLITRRKSETHLGGLWEFPGGKRLAVESLEDCLRRELREEVGIEITAPVLVTRIEYDYPDRTVELHFFTCSIAQGPPRPIGCDEIRWVRPDELLGLEFPPADRHLIESLASKLTAEG